jgi:ribosomal protein L40E
VTLFALAHAQVCCLGNPLCDVPHQLPYPLIAKRRELSTWHCQRCTANVALPTLHCQRCTANVALPTSQVPRDGPAEILGRSEDHVAMRRHGWARPTRWRQVLHRDRWTACGTSDLRPRGQLRLGVHLACRLQVNAICHVLQVNAICHVLQVNAICHVLQATPYATCSIQFQAVLRFLVCASGCLWAISASTCCR